MKKPLNILLGTFALLSLIACGPTKSSSQGTVSSVPETIYHHVTFINDDDSVLEEKDVVKGAKAVYTGTTPTKEEDDEFTYEFLGWDKEDELNVVISNVTTKAQYKAVAKENWGPIIWF